MEPYDSAGSAFFVHPQTKTHEDESPMEMMNQLYGSLQTDSEHWVLVTAHEDLLKEENQLFPGRKYYVTRRLEPAQPPHISIVIQVSFRLQRYQIPVFAEETFENVLLAIELALNLPLKWELRDHRFQLVTSKEELMHKYRHVVSINSNLDPLKKLIRTGQNGISWKCPLEDLAKALQQIETKKNEGERQTSVQEHSERR
jgi:hypothetical protein